MYITTEIRQSLYRTIKTSVFTLLWATRPHPVGRKTHTVKTIGKRSPYNICKSLSYRQHTAGFRWCKTGLTKSSSNTFYSTIVKSHNTTIAQWQLYLTLTLLSCYLTGYRAVNLIGKPIFTSHSLQLQHTFKIRVKRSGIISNIFIMTFNSLVHHICFRRMSEHLSHIKVKRLNAITLYKREVSITCCLSHHI